MVLLAFYLGIGEGINTISIESTMLSTLEAFAAFVLLFLLWRKLTTNQSFDLREIMPNRRDFAILTILMGVLYIVSFFFIRFDAIPKTLMPYLTIALLYALCGFLLVRAINKSPHPAIVFPRLTVKHWFLKTLGFAIVFAASGILWMNVKPIAQQIVLFSWIAGVIVGIIIVITSIVKALQRPAGKGV